MVDFYGKRRKIYDRPMDPMGFIQFQCIDALLTPRKYAVHDAPSILQEMVPFTVPHHLLNMNSGYPAATCHRFLRAPPSVDAQIRDATTWAKSSIFMGI